MFSDVSGERNSPLLVFGISENAPERLFKSSAAHVRKIKKAKASFHPRYDGYRSSAWCDAGCSPDYEQSKR